MQCTMCYTAAHWHVACIGIHIAKLAACCSLAQWWVWQCMPLTVHAHMNAICIFMHRWWDPALFFLGGEARLCAIRHWCRPRSALNASYEITWHTVSMYSQFICFWNCTGAIMMSVNEGVLWHIWAATTNFVNSTLIIIFNPWFNLKLH